MGLVLRRRRQHEARPVRPSGRPAEQGFSLLEVLIAALVLLVVLLGIVPLFMRSMTNNVAGRESSSVSNFSRDRVEELYPLPLDREELEVEAGQQLREDVHFWDTTTHAWVDTEPTVDPATGISTPWQQTTHIRIYHISDLNEPIGPDRYTFSDPRDGSTPAVDQHVREIAVTVEGLREAGTLGPARQIDVTTLRSF